MARCPDLYGGLAGRSPFLSPAGPIEKNPFIPYKDLKPNCWSQTGQFGQPIKRLFGVGFMLIPAQNQA